MQVLVGVEKRHTFGPKLLVFQQRFADVNQYPYGILLVGFAPQCPIGCACNHFQRREFEARKWKYCYLDGATKHRMKEVATFNKNREIPAFLISLKAGGVGLNLTGADMVIHFDPWWNPAVEDQATDRAYRIGQKRTVYSIKLITRGTIEEKVLEMQKRKKAIIDAALTKDEDVMQKLEWEDVQELLNL